jgi:hypothetical protein
VPVNPATFSQRLERAGFVDAEIELYQTSSFRFRARKP